MSLRTTAIVSLYLAFTCAAQVAAAQAAAVRSRSCAGVSFPTTVRVADNDLRLNGLGLREVTFLNVDVYVAALYVMKPSRSAETLLHASTPTRVVLHLVRDTSTEELRDELETGLHNNAPYVSAEKKRLLFSLLEPLSKGDTLVEVRRAAALGPEGVCPRIRDIGLVGHAHRRTVAPLAGRTQEEQSHETKCAHLHKLLVPRHSRSIQESERTCERMPVRF